MGECSPHFPVVSLVLCPIEFGFFFVSIAMPSVSKAQAAFMKAAAHSPKFAKQAGIPVKVAKEFMAEDKKAGKYTKGKK